MNYTATDESFELKISSKESEMFLNLKDGLKEIIDIVNDVPEKYKDKCFEMLMNALLQNTAGAKPIAAKSGSDLKPQKPGNASLDGFMIPIRLKAFFQKFNLPESAINKLFLSEGGEIHFIKEPPISKSASGQITWSLLLALRNSLLSGDFLVSADEVKEVCMEKKMYDPANFAAVFKRNENLFKSAPVSKSAAVKLSPAGEKELAELIESLTKE